MNNNTADITELLQSMNRLISGYSNLTPAVKQETLNNNKVNEPFNEKNPDASGEIAGYFEMMLSATKSMLGNMNMMDTGFAKTVEIIVKILSSIGGSPGGFGGLFGGLLGIIGGIAGGPLGAAIGGGIGSVIGRSKGELNSRLNSVSDNQGGIINQVIIKNPVTFTKAFDVEVRTRNLRGGIDL